MLVEPHSGRVSSGSACAICRQTAPWAGLPGTPEVAGGATPTPRRRRLRGRTAKRASDGRSAALAIPVLASLLAPAGQLPVPLDGLDPPPAHRNRDEGPVFDDQARTMSLRAAWSLRTLPTTRHRCRCVFSQATATSMPPRSSRSEFQPWTRRSRSSPLHRRRSSGSSSMSRTKL